MSGYIFLSQSSISIILLITSTTMQMNYSFLCFHSSLYKNCLCSFYYFFKYCHVFSSACNYLHHNSWWYSSYFSRYWIWIFLFQILYPDASTVGSASLSSRTFSVSGYDIDCVLVFQYHLQIIGPSFLSLKSISAQTLYFSPFSIILNSYTGPGNNL